MKTKVKKPETKEHPKPTKKEKAAGDHLIGWAIRVGLFDGDGFEREYPGDDFLFGRD